jgi:hypothetical protein
MDLTITVKNKNFNQNQNTLTLPKRPEACGFHGSDDSDRVSARVFNTRFTDPWDLKSSGTKTVRSTDTLVSFEDTRRPRRRLISATKE